jgi:hypothetical protein
MITQQPVDLDPFCITQEEYDTTTDENILQMKYYIHNRFEPMNCSSTIPYSYFIPIDVTELLLLPNEKICDSVINPMYYNKRENIWCIIYGNLKFLIHKSDENPNELYITVSNCNAAIAKGFLSGLITKVVGQLDYVLK